MVVLRYVRCRSSYFCNGYNYRPCNGQERKVHICGSFALYPLEYPLGSSKSFREQLCNMDRRVVTLAARVSNDSQN